MKNFTTTNRLELELDKLFAPDYVEPLQSDSDWFLLVPTSKQKRTEKILDRLKLKYKDQQFEYVIWKEYPEQDSIGYGIFINAPTGEDMAFELDAFKRYERKQVKIESTIKGTHYELDNVGKEWAVWSKDSRKYVALGKKKDMKRKFDSLEKLKADLDLDLDSSIKQAPSPNDTILENTDYVGDVEHLSDERFNTLKDLFMSLYDNYILVPITSSDTDFYRGIWLDDSGDYLIYRNYGQSADKATIENLAWIIDTIFEGVEFKKTKLVNENTKPNLEVNLNVLEESLLQDLQRDRLRLNPTERVLMEFYLEQHPDKDLGQVLYQESEWDLFEAWGDEVIARGEVRLWVDSYRLNQDHAIDQIQTVFGEPPLNYEEKYLDNPGVFTASFNVLPEDALDATTSIVDDSRILLEDNGIKQTQIRHDKDTNRLEIRVVTDKLLWATLEPVPVPEQGLEPIKENKSIDKTLGTKPRYRRGDLVFHKDHGYGVVTVGANRGSLTVNFSNEPLPRAYMKRFEKPANHPDNKWSTQKPVGIRVDMEDLRPVLGENKRRMVVKTEQENYKDKKLTLDQIDTLIHEIGNPYLSEFGNIEVYRDRDDYIEPDSMAKILSSENIEDAYNDLVFEIEDNSIDYLMDLKDNLGDNIIKGLESRGVEITEEVEELLNDYLYEGDIWFDLPRYDEDYFEAFIMISTPEEQNLDHGAAPSSYYSNMGYPIPIDEVIADTKLSFVGDLIESQGYKVEEVMKFILGKPSKKLVEKLKSSKFVDSLTDEVYNSSSPMNILTVIGSLTLRDVIDLEDGSKTLTLTPSDVIGLFDPWQGGGSIFEITLEKPVTIAKENIYRVGAAMARGGRRSGVYSPEEVYGFGRGTYRNKLDIKPTSTKDKGE